MKIAIITRGPDSHSYQWEDAFANGLVEHDIYPDKYSPGDRPTDIDCAVIWGINNTAMIKHFDDNDINYIVLERGYIGDRTKWTSCGFNGLNGHANFLPEFADDKRLHHVQKYLKPIRKKKGRYILIMGQVASDASVKHIGFNKWLQKTFDRLNKSTDLPIYYRPHPLDPDAFIPEGLKIRYDSLKDSLNGAFVVVTLNSNTGVDALLAGVPVICDDAGSMIYQCIDRNDWLQNISYAQWSIEEMASGETWRHLRGGLI